MYILNKGTCNDPLVMEWMRELFWLSAKHNFYLTARHIMGKLNVISDTLSRISDFGYCLDSVLLIPPDLAFDDHNRIYVSLYNHVLPQCFDYLQELWANSGKTYYKKLKDTEQWLLQRILSMPTAKCTMLI